MTGSLLDTALDLSVVGGCTNVGYRIRSRGWNPLPRMEGKVVLITGATSGLGLAAADGFARLGARVWLAIRNRERGEWARARMPDHRGEAEVRVELCDVSRPGAGARRSSRPRGGPGDRTHSEHLPETALLLRHHGPPQTYFRLGWWSGRRASPTGRCDTWPSGCPR